MAPDWQLYLHSAILLPVESVNEFREPPVTAPMVMSPVPFVALVSIVVLLMPNVTAPKG